MEIVNGVLFCLRIDCSKKEKGLLTHIFMFYIILTCIRTEYNTGEGYRSVSWSVSYLVKPYPSYIFHWFPAFNIYFKVVVLEYYKLFFVHRRNRQRPKVYLTFKLLAQ